MNDSKVAVAVLPARRQRVRELLPWIPLAFLVLLLLASCLGLRMSSAGAATATEYVDVQGVVDKEIHLTPTCAGGALNFGTVIPDDPAVQTASNCVMVFGTNNSALGADLVVSETGAAAGDAMKCLAICGADTIADYQGLGMPAAPASAFAMRLASTTGANAVWTPAGTLAGQMYDVQDAPDLACQTASAADGTCEFRFAAQAASVSDSPGSYQASVDFTALAR